MGRKLPPLNALRAFEVAGRRGSLTSAARELQVSVAAVSRHVALLEAYLGRQLLRRERTGVAPTPQGLAYLREIGAALDRIEQAGQDLRATAEPRQVRLAAYPTFTTEWLAGRLPAFRAAYPDIELDIVVSRPGTTRVTGRADLWVTVFPEEVGDHPSAPLFDTLATLVCTPTLRDGTPPLRRPTDLPHHLLLHAARERPQWDALLAALGADEMAAMRRLRFDTLGLTFQAARGGAGVALGNPFFLVDDLVSARLVMPFDTILRFDAGHRLACDRARAADPAVAAVRAWLSDEAAHTMTRLETLLAGRPVTPAHVAFDRAGLPLTPAAPR